MERLGAEYVCGMSLNAQNIALHCTNGKTISMGHSLDSIKGPKLKFSKIPG